MPCVFTVLFKVRNKKKSYLEKLIKGLIIFSNLKKDLELG